MLICFPSLHICCEIVFNFCSAFTECKRDNMSHICLLFTTFVTTFWEMFLEYSWNILEKVFKKILKFFLKKFTLFYLGLCQNFGKKCHLKKKFKFIYKSFYYLKTSVTVFNECFC